jgi:hypothetical protein
MFHTGPDLNSVKDMFKKLYLLLVLATALPATQHRRNQTTNTQALMTCNPMSSKVLF